MSKPSVLFVFTSADRLLDGAATGWYLPEAAHPYYVLKPDFNLVAASPKGGKPPVDENSVKMFTDDESVKFNTTDKEAIAWIENTHKIKDLNAKDYAAVFVVGGHGPLIDLAVDKDFAQLLQDFYAAKKPISAVCHGPGGLVLATKPNSSESILAGATLTGFSNSEEAQTPYNDFTNILPFSLEDKLASLGSFVKGDDWGVKVVYDKGILTGQNPASAKALGEKLSEILKA
ncbi:hypothetical protein P7C73_g5818, partial [Tremellales sp. Uapishka_1]